MVILAEVEMRYITTPDNGLKDAETGIVWEYFATPGEAERYTKIANQIHWARQAGCKRPCSSPNTPGLGVMGLPPCYICFLPNWNNPIKLEFEAAKLEFARQVSGAVR
jgi:hypothetical protein